MKTTIISMLIVTAAAGGAYIWSTAASTPEVPFVSGLETRTIVDAGAAVNGVVPYSYLGESVPARLAADEVVELRTNTSYTRHLRTVGEGSTAVDTLQTVIYTQPTFAQDVDGSWKLLEYATTTEVAYRERTVSLGQRLVELFVRSAYAATASPFSEAGDGYIGAVAGTISTCDGVAFSNARLDTTGADDDTSTSAAASASQTYDGGLTQCDASIQRIWLPFNTGSIPAAATISAATLNVYVLTSSVLDNDAQAYITVVRTSQATHSSLAGADYDNIGTAEGVDAGGRQSISGLPSSAYIAFTINSTGQGWIAKSGVASNCSASTGYTCYGLREGHDNTGSPIGQDTANDFTISTSEQGSTTQDPYLTVTYTAPSTSAFWMWSDY